MLPKRMDHETKNRDRDAGIGHVERRPGMSVGDVQVEEQKVDHVSVEKPVGKISQNPGKQQPERYIAPCIRRAASDEKANDEEQRDTRNHHEKSVVVFEGAKGGAGVGDIDEMKKTRHDPVRFVGTNVRKDKMLGQLIERVKREGEKQDEFHFRPPSVMSSEVETSLILIFDEQQEIPRLRSE
jgi:hypothetical protein